MRRARPRGSDTSRTLHLRGTRRYFLTLEEPPMKHWELIPTERGEDGSPRGPCAQVTGGEGSPAQATPGEFIRVGITSILNVSSVLNYTVS